MSVSLVKITPATVVYVAGFSFGPYSSDPDNVHAFATIDDARASLADDLQRASDEMFDRELEDARMDYATEAEYSADYESAHEGSTSIAGSAGLVKSDPDGDITYALTHGGGWSTSEPDDYVYWIDASTIGAVFGDDTESDEYLDLIDALLSR